jgi:hypothetical protein
MMRVRALRLVVRPLLPLFPPRVLLFVLLFAWFLHAVVDLRLVFMARHVLFLRNLRYLTDFLGQPGSLLEWTDNLLVQFCYFGWPAAIALAAATWLLLVSTIGLMNVLCRGSIGGAWVIPGILVVVLYSGYSFPTPVIVGLTLAVTAANVWVRMPAGRLWLRLALFLAVSAVLYYIAGGAAYYCFAACCVIHEGLAERRRGSGVLLLLAALAVKFGLDAFLFAQFDLASRNFHVFSGDNPQDVMSDWRMMALYLYFPVCALFVVFRRSIIALATVTWRRLRKLLGKPPLPEQGEHGSRNRTRPDRAGRGFARGNIPARVRWTGGTLLTLSLAAAAGYYCLDRPRKSLLEIDFCAEYGLWDELLAHARTLPPAAYSEYVNHDVNRALCHTRRLPYEMLSYPQVHLPLLSMNDVRGKSPLFCKPCDLLLEVGRVDEAEHLALEMLELRPFGGVLKRLAVVKMIKGQPAAARVLLNVLRDDLVWGRWAEERLQRLQADPEMAGDDEIQRIRRLMLSKDDMHLFSRFLADGSVFSNNRIWLLDLLKQNGENRMAFEYLMAICLCDRDLEAVAQLFPYLDGLSYAATPPLYEEAILLYSNAHPGELRKIGSDVFFHDRRISESTMSKFRRFQAIVAQCGGAKEKMEPALAGELGKTYFYFYCFHAARKRS